VTRNDPVPTSKAYGKSIKASQLPEGIARFFPVASSEAQAAQEQLLAAEPTPAVGTGLPKDILLPILESLREDVAEIRDVFAGLELRMVGGSLLVVYEADWARAREGVKLWLEGGQDDEDEEEDEDEDEENKKPGPPYAVKLIDFAHTRIVPGMGPDKGVLLGMDTVLKLLDGRIEEVKAAV
jgi:inositol-polyphosphate multikinase